MDLARRGFLRVGGGALAAGLVSAIATPALADFVTRTHRTLAFSNTHTGEKVAVDYWANGKYIDGAMREINHVLRDWRNNEVHSMDPKLMDLLSLMRGWIGSSEPFHIISGYRSPRSNAMLAEHSGGVAKKSLHMVGKAIDIRLPGCALKSLHSTARAMRCGGVGYYPGSDFVHVDTGRVRSWHG